VTALREVWQLLTGSRALPVEPTFVGPDNVFASVLGVSELALTSVAASLVAASSLSAARADGRLLPVSLETCHVATAFHSERHARVNGQRAAPGFAPLSRFWPASDGWIRTHANYPWHETRLLSVLGVDADVDAVGAAIAKWDAAELEEAIFAANGCAAKVREPAAWDAHPHGTFIRNLRLLSLDRVGDMPARQKPASRRAMDGVRVLDLTRVIAGPVCTRTLAAHGADVLRIDSPSLPELDSQWIDSTPGKRSASLDFTTDAGRSALERLLDRVDVVVSGYRPGALDPFGLGPVQLAREHPGVILVTLSAWGDRGPWGGRRGFDSLVQAASGIACVEAGDDPQPGVLPAQALDHATGYLAAAATMAALTRQAAEGGTWHARLSLAQTAAWLLRAPRPSAVAAPPTWDPASYVVDLPRGTDVLSLVAPPGMLGGERLEWPSAPPESGADPPEWRSSSMTDVPPTSRLAGQLGYLFEERPEMRIASVDDLVERLNHEDRYSRARAAYPIQTDAFVRAHIDEFPPRITRAMVEEALQRLRSGD
jgi:CoA-transferase family III